MPGSALPCPSSCPPHPLTPRIFLEDPASQTPQEVLEPECLPGIIFNGSWGVHLGKNQEREDTLILFL